MESQTWPKGGSLLSTSPSDGYLLLLSRSGNVNAKSEFYKRYFDKRYLVGRSVSPTLIKLLDPWEFNHAFFDAFTSMCRNYTFAANASIKTYFSVLMKNSLVSEANSNCVFERANTLSLDEEYYSEQGEPYTLGEAIPDKSEYNNVTYYMDYVESIDRLSNASSRLSKQERKIVGLRMDGRTFREIASDLKISITQAHQVFTSFCSKIKETLTKAKVPSYLLNARSYQKQAGFAGVN
ncbi:MAG: hypothetical protein IKX82_01445 [Bacilli bacterium]|nr:hypothetical protein [Bacilli bacterium]